MAETPAVEDAPSAGPGDEIKPYKVHVSSKYLELTRQKLELTRLPHEAASPPSQDWWEPKPQVEPLIDFWLEKYSWKDQEAHLNKTPQFRTAISIPSSENPLRLHFIHVPSSHDHALPLLLIPPFPFSNLALTHVVDLFTQPENATTNQPFHLVIPALPGLGFSDPFPNNTAEISTTTEMLNTLMTRLGYERYLVSNVGAAQMSPAEIDWKIIDHMATHYPDSCIGAHFIAPPLVSPKLSEAPIEWAKWTIASTLSAGILGYSQQDFSALKQSSGEKGTSKKGLTPSKLGMNNVGLREPNTLSYAMCDSPTGLLAFALKGLRLLAPQKPFTAEQVITLTNLAWLPGPEYAMRFWAHCAEHQANDIKKVANTAKPNVAITVFLGGEDHKQEDGTEGDDTTAREVGAGAIPLDSPVKLGPGVGYSCPAWGKARYNVLFSQRVAGEPGLLAWDRPETILAGIRGLATEILKVDQRLRPAVEEPPTAPLENVVIANEEIEEKEGGLKPPERPVLEQGDSSRTQVASQPPSSPKGKEPEMVGGPETTPKQTAQNKPDSVREGTPDTVVLVTAPTEDDVLSN